MDHQGDDFRVPRRERAKRVLSAFSTTILNYLCSCTPRNPLNAQIAKIVSCGSLGPVVSGRENGE